MGCNRLIQQGAKAVLSVPDILEEFGLKPRTPQAPPRPPDLDALSDMQRSLWEALAVPRHVDALAAATRTAASHVLTALTEMEMYGLVRQQPGMHFERT